MTSKAKTVSRQRAIAIATGNGRPFNPTIKKIESTLEMIANHQPYQLGYAVANLELAAAYWANTFGAGPFFSIGEAVFDAATMHGKDCTFRHAPAFGNWHGLIIELQEIIEISPVALAQRFVPGPMPVLNHVAFISDDPAEASATLSASGLELFMHATMGEIEIRFHDARHTLGCAVEIHRKSAFLDAFNAKVKEASIGWDGTAPLRPMAF